MAGSYEAMQAGLRRAGVMEAADTDTFFDALDAAGEFLEMLVAQPEPVDEPPPKCRADRLLQLGEPQARYRRLPALPHEVRRPWLSARLLRNATAGD